MQDTEQAERTPSRIAIEVLAGYPDRESMRRYLIERGEKYDDIEPIAMIMGRIARRAFLEEHTNRPFTK